MPRPGTSTGDGYSDIIVGAYYHDAGGTDRGQAYVYLGSASGPATTAAWTGSGDQDSAYFGRSVATAGDVNGDGYSDIIIGAYSRDVYGTDRGQAYVYLGSASGPATTAAWTGSGYQNSAYFGGSVATAGDVNGDGYSDIIVGALGHDAAGADRGQAYVYLGSASGLATTAAWTGSGDQDSAYFGYSVATAGDVNGDGYSDIIIGAAYHDAGGTNRGQAYVYCGNEGRGLSLTPQQRRSDDTAPVAHLGRSDSLHSFEMALTGRTPFGRGKFKLEWEAKVFGTPFDGSGTARTAIWQDTSAPGLLRKEIVSGLIAGTTYHWRARLLYHPVTTPFQQKSRWLTIPWNGWQEADFVTAFGEADCGVTQTDNPDPVLLGGNITYLVTAANTGPNEARVTLTDTILAGTAVVSATPSQGTCSESGGVLTCTLGLIASGANATLTLVVTPQAAGSYTNHAVVFSNAVDGNPGNNTDDETTTVNATSIGNFVWEDTDGDGIQDAGEPGIANVYIVLLDGSLNPVAAAVTNPSGFYEFTGLTYGISYLIKVFPPSAAYFFSPQDQGPDDALDSDVDATTGQTTIFSLVDWRDPTRWDAGLQNACDPPDEACWIYSVTRTVPDNYPTLNFQDPNQPGQRTGWNIRRSSNPALPKDTWPIIGSNVTDMDLGAPNYQYTDITGGTGTWYYQVTAYNAYCPAEGPF